MKITVYCGSDLAKDPCYNKAAIELGKWIGEKSYTLIYGGGDSGLMGLVAKEAHDLGTEVIGVVPQNVDFIKNRPQPYVTDLHAAADMSERKKIMFELADVFIALPGGIGTLDEITEVITLVKIGVADKKCILFNRNGFYDSLKQFFDQMIESGFLAEEQMKHVLFSDDIAQIEEFICGN